MKKILLSILLFTLSACVSGLNSIQKQELNEVKYSRPDIYIEEKNPAVGTMLGFILGGGSFYTGNIGAGIASLLLWPLSIFWDPINGYNGAMEQNYTVTKYNYNKLKREGKINEQFF
jgi:hypothetical protein